MDPEFVLHTHSGYYLATMNNDMEFEGKWMQLEDMLSEVSQDQKHKRCMFSLIVDDRSKDKHIHKTKYDYIQI
jgi:hypothetical protein